MLRVVHEVLIYCFCWGIEGRKREGVMVVVACERREWGGDVDVSKCVF